VNLNSPGISYIIWFLIKFCIHC